MLKKLMRLLISGVMLVGLTACHQKEAKNEVRVGTIAGPETQLMEVAKQVALNRYGLHVNIITFSDYNTPNEALADGSVDANMFQHLPYLKAQIEMRGYKIVSIGKTFVYPMGLYSKKITALTQLKTGAKNCRPKRPQQRSACPSVIRKGPINSTKDSRYY